MRQGYPGNAASISMVDWTTGQGDAWFWVVKMFIDTLGSLWQAGKLINKTFTASTSAQTLHGGHEMQRTVRHGSTRSGARHGEVSKIAWILRQCRE